MKKQEDEGNHSFRFIVKMPTKISNGGQLEPTYNPLHKHTHKHTHLQTYK